MAEANSKCFTVNFTCKVNEKDVKEKLQGISEKDIKKQAKELSKELL